MLSPIQLKFLQKLVLDSSRRGETASAEYFESNFGIGARIGRGYEYTASDSDKARKMLIALDLPVTQETGTIDRADAVLRSGMTEKSGTLAPHGNSVAFRICGNSGTAGTSENWGFGAGYQVATPAEVAQIWSEVKFNCTMVVENFETFRQLHRYNWVTQKIRDQTVFVIFRGDPIYKTDAARIVVEQVSGTMGGNQNKPVLGFFDFDPAGLFMCSELQGLSKVVLPDMDTLLRATKAGKRDDLYFDQVAGFGPSLDKHPHPEIAGAWSMMKSIRVGLPQEWMRDL